jgi:hypothetical protein
MELTGSEMRSKKQIFPLVLPVPGGGVTSKEHFVIVDHGKEIRLVNTGAGRVIIGNARKQ